MDLSHKGYEIGVWCYKGVNKLKLAKIDWVRVNSYYFIDCIIFFLSSPFLFVFGDDHVTCHVRANVNPGEHDDA